MNMDDEEKIMCFECKFFIEIIKTQNNESIIICGSNGQKTGICPCFIHNCRSFKQKELVSENT